MLLSGVGRRAAHRPRTYGNDVTTVLPFAVRAPRAFAFEIIVFTNLEVLPARRRMVPIQIWPGDRKLSPPRGCQARCAPLRERHGASVDPWLEEGLVVALVVNRGVRERFLAVRSGFQGRERSPLLSPFFLYGVKKSG